MIGTKSYNSTTCNGTAVAGITRDKAAQVWYRALTTYWTSLSTYPEAANGMVLAARDLYGAGSTECSRTVAAWKARQGHAGRHLRGGAGAGRELRQPGLRAGQ